MPIELDPPVFLSLTGLGTIKFKAPGVLALFNKTAGGGALKKNTAASFCTSEASILGSGGGSAESVLVVLLKLVEARKVFFAGHVCKLSKNFASPRSAG